MIGEFQWFYTDFNVGAQVYLFYITSMMGKGDFFQLADYYVAVVIIVLNSDHWVEKLFKVFRIIILGFSLGLEFFNDRKAFHWWGILGARSLSGKAAFVFVKVFMSFWLTTIHDIHLCFSWTGPSCPHPMPSLKVGQGHLLVPHRTKYL